MDHRLRDRRIGGRQHGIATILVLLMLGLVVGVSALGMFHVLRGTQARSVSVHASTPAQATAWRGVEVVRRYLEVTEKSVLEHWEDSGGTLLSLNPGHDTDITARITDVEEITGSGSVDPHYRVTARVGGLAASGTTAQTAATVQVVYKVRVLPPPGTPGTGGGATIPAATINANLVMLGNLQIKADSGTSVVLSVGGDVKGGGSLSLANVDTLRATGSIHLDSGEINLNRVHANGDIKIEKGARVAEVASRGKVDVSSNQGALELVSIHAHGDVNVSNAAVTTLRTRGNLAAGAGVTVGTGTVGGAVAWSGAGGGAGSLHANGDIAYHTATSSHADTALSSRGAINVTGAGAHTVHANGNVVYGGEQRLEAGNALGSVTLSGSAGADRIRAKGDITMGSGSVGDLEGEGNLHVVNGGTVATGIIAGQVTPDNATGVNVVQVPSHRVQVNEVAVVEVAEVPEVSVSVTIDVYPLREAANYVFETVGGKTRVTVRSVSGIPDGEYWLAGGELCSGVPNNGGKCPVATTARICTTGSCITQLSNTVGWKLDGETAARGVMWFDGALELAKGGYVNTFLATGDITTKVSTMAPNFAGAAAVCRNGAVPELGLADGLATFTDLVPTNLCNTTTGEMIPNPLGNVAYISGGLLPGSGGTATLTGGNIDISITSNAVDGNGKSPTYGAVMAANDLNLQGNNTIHGTVTVGAQGTSNEVKWTGDNLIDLTGGSDDYDPGELPCMINCGATPGTPSAAATVLWSRYL